MRRSADVPSTGSSSRSSSRETKTHKSIVIQVRPPIAAATLVTMPAWTERRFIAASEPPLKPNLRSERSIVSTGTPCDKGGGRDTPAEPDERAARRNEKVSLSLRRRDEAGRALDARAEDDVRDRVRTVGELGGAVAATTAEVERPDERRRAARDVHGPAAREIEVSVLETPSSRVPRAVSDRAVDDRAPDEADDEDGEETSALGDAGDGDDGRQGGEHCETRHQQTLEELVEG